MKHLTLTAVSLLLISLASASYSVTIMSTDTSWTAEILGITSNAWNNPIWHKTRYSTFAKLKKSSKALVIVYIDEKVASPRGFEPLLPE
jgi:hypothetical protein